MNASDRALILQAQEGSVDAFSELVERNWVWLVRFARSVAGGADAEDIVQESLVAAWSRMSSLRDPDAFPAWLLRIVARRCFRNARKRARWVPLPMSTDYIDPAGCSPAESVDVERVLNILPVRQRAVMHFTVIEGRSDSEIGALLGIAAASVRAHRRRARATLRTALGEPRIEKGLSHEIT